MIVRRFVVSGALVLNHAVTALKNGVGEMLDVLYEDTKEQE